MSHSKSKVQNQTSDGSYELTSGSVEETQALGRRLGQLVGPGDVIALHGELGTGKTTLIQGFAEGLEVPMASVKSPTFVLQREYAGRARLIHIDAYRLDGPEQAAWLDTELMFSPNAVTVIEWAERFGPLMPEDRLEAHLSHVSTNRRAIRLTATGPRSAEIVKKIGDASDSPRLSTEKK